MRPILAAVGATLASPGLRKMLQDTECYSVLAYEPPNAKHDGTLRRIEVRVPE